MNTILERNSDLAERYPEFSCLLVEHADALTTPFRMLIREARVSSEFQGEKLRLMLEYLVFSIVPFLTHDDPKRDSPMPAAIEEAKWMLEERPEKEWKVDELAKVVCLAPKYFSSLFARHVGVPPYQFVLQQRIYRAQDLLRDENLPVGEVAHQLGFSSTRRFTSSFKKFAGTTPSAWRKSREKAAGGRTA